MVTIKDVLKVVEDVSGHPDLRIRSKKNDLPIWRGMYCKLALELTKASIQDIGEEIDRDHATVHYWKKTFLHTFITRPEFKTSYKYAKKKLASPLFRVEYWADAQAEEIINKMVKK